VNSLLCRKVPAEDGVRLATDVWLPDGPGPFPVLLTRTPYHRRADATTYAPTETYTSWGYAHVVQDVRGKFDSEGVFRPMMDEATDGGATLDWIANQKWCNGRIGLVGKSYLGMVQIPAAASGHEALRCIVPGVAPNSFFIDWLRYDGCFALANAVRWSLTCAVVPTTPACHHFQWKDLWAQPTLEAVFERTGFDSAALKDWVEHDRYDEYWRRVDQHRMYPEVTVPGLHVAGWYDHISRGQFQAYQGIRDAGCGPRARKCQRLQAGPWGHANIGMAQYGEWDFGPDAAFDQAAYERRFLDLWMRDLDDGISEEPPVFLFVMGMNRWMHFNDWPVPGSEVASWYLRSKGNAVTVGGDGALSPETPGAEPPDRYSYDPADPTPTRGGSIYWGLENPGPVSQRPILDRQDVLYYRSEPLGKPLAVVGEVNLDLWIASDAADTDFIAKLCVVEPSGRVIPLTIGSLRCRYRNGWDKCEALPKDTPTPIRVQMGNVAYVFPQGSRISLIVTSSSYPRILPHPNTMAPTWRESSPRIALNQVLHDTEHASRLLLPIVDIA